MLGDSLASTTVTVPDPSAAAATPKVDGRPAGAVPVDGRTTVAARGGFDRPPLERSGKVARLYSEAREVARALGQELGEGGTGGGSDGNFTAALGVPTLDGLGAVGDGAHALHEHVDIESLSERAALVAGLMTRIK